MVELLTVIAIIGVLAALVMLALGRVRESARRSTCANNLRQIASGLFLYASEHQRQLPPVSKSWPPASQQDTWGYAIWSYIGYRNEDFNDPANDLVFQNGGVPDRNIFQCPTTQVDPTPAPGVNLRSSPYSYGLNSNPIGSGTVYWTASVRLNQIKTPAQTAMVLESDFPLADSAGYRLWYGMIPHAGGTNVAFYDGHIELRTSDTISGDETKPFWGK